LKSHQGKDKQERDESVGDSKLLEETLNNFGIDAKVTQASVGPVVTRFEIQPAPGVKVSSITALSDDIALSLAAQSVRIETPVPGKQVLGIEVPNRRRKIVSLKEVLSSNEYRSLKSKLSIALGKDISGKPVVVDLVELPHLLIAGATGSGKTICINSIITSILYKARPDEVKLLVIDPKRVELTVFGGIPHLLTPIVTDPKEAGFMLKVLVDEMEERYKLFASCGVRDIEGFYAKAEEEGASKIPYIVMIIDELADLMMVAQRDFEDAVIRLAQMARAVGIHLILATQRPSVDILTGLIKANFPSRIAFQVSSKVDSRTILDTIGAEKLLGRGDMLFSLPNLPKPIRVQGCYISSTELEEVVDFVRKQEWQEEYHCEFKRKIERRREGREEEEEEDDLFNDALRVVVEEGRASTSLLQRRLRIGYNRAARLIDRLEEKGFISPADGSKPREVLVSDDFLEK
jgi:S-DNA-T family DNA segregation ATPase FtsK/SpoIIIE